MVNSKKVVISIPVHEQPLVVADHLRNIRKFVPNSGVVLHASADSGLNFIEAIKVLTDNEFKDFAFLNPKNFHTHSNFDAGFVTGLSSVHSSNFKYIDSILNFDVMCLETSNDMFVRTGVERLFNDYECGGSIQRQDRTAWDDWKRKVPNIGVVERYCKIITTEKLPQEGSFYPREVFREVADIVEKTGTFLAMEEVVIPTLAYNLYPELYDKNINDNYVFHRWQDGATQIQDIHDVRDGKYPNKYVVKRVPRRIDDACRRYVNELTKND